MIRDCRQEAKVKQTVSCPPRLHCRPAYPLGASQRHVKPAPVVHETDSMPRIRPRRREHDDFLFSTLEAVDRTDFNS